MKIYIIVLCTFLIGCVPPQKENYFEDTITNYQIGIIKRASIGDQIIEITRGKFTTIKSYKSLTTDTIPFESVFNKKKNEFIFINEGEIFEIKNEYESYLNIKSTIPDRSMFTFAISKEGTLLYIFDGYVRLSLRKEIGHIMFEAAKPIREIKELSFSYELILTEISSDYIKATYREYTGDGRIKDAFSYPITFNIANTNIIQFKSNKIEIKNKFNNQIDYVVLSD